MNSVIARRVSRRRRISYLVARELRRIFSSSIIYSRRESAPLVLCTRARCVYTHAAEFLIGGCRRLRDFRRARCNTRDTVVRAEVFRNYGEKYAAFISSPCRQRGERERERAATPEREILWLRLRSRAAIYFQAVRKSTSVA